LQEKRAEKERQEKADKFLSDSLKHMEQAALAGTAIVPANRPFTSQNENRTRPPLTTSMQAGSNWNPRPHPHSQYHSHNSRSLPDQGQYSVPGSAQSGLGNIIPNTTLNTQTHASRIAPSNHSSSSQLEQEKIDWQAQKLKRQEDNDNKRKKVEGDDGNDENDKVGKKRKMITILPGEGFYSYNAINSTGGQEVKDGEEKDSKSEPRVDIYLEGEVFFGLLEEDMPVQLWTGSSASRVEKQQPHNIRHWKNALVVAVVHHRAKNSADKCDDNLQRPTCHVSYLSSHEDTEETIEREVPVDRIRIILGGDERIPDDLEEARLLAMGGEEIDVSGNERASATATNDKQDNINEATGLSAWSTVTIKKTTHRQQHREEKQRIAELKTQAAQKREAEKRRVVERRLEEARASNADDSALGAYDVWGKMDYKGVDISKEIHCSVEDTAKRLAPLASEQSAENGMSGVPTSGVKVAFKKRAKKKGQRAARRRTSADDDN